MKSYKIFYPLLALFVFASISIASAQQADPLQVNRDFSVKPGVDFFHYANGTWFKNNPIPASETTNGLWSLITDTINAQIKRICELSAEDSDAPKGSNKQKIGDFYFSGMDTVTIEKLGLEPLRADINKIEGITDVKSLLSVMAYLRKISVDPGFSFYIGQDEKNSEKYVINFGQGGLGLGEREYYVSTDEANIKIKNEYVKHLTAMFKLMGYDDNTAASNAATVMKMETEFANNSRKMEDLRDPEHNYNKMSVDKFNQLTPSVSWAEVIGYLGIPNADTVNVGQPEFFTGFEKSLKNFSIEDWKTYLKWNLVNSYADYLSTPFVNQNFDFYYRILEGVPEMRPRWKRIVDQTNGSLGELIGQVYVAEYTPAGTKEKLLEIGNNIKAVYGERIKKLDWMSEATKKKALNKLSKVFMKVGYPDKWRDMSALQIDRSSYANNVKRVIEWYYNYRINKYGKPVDRTEWGMTPQTYNAYYSPTNNEICVPACNIMVPGFEGRLPDDAVLYGIIGGSTFGHEITHGFDDQGSKYDEFGNLNEWWTKEDREKFTQKTKKIVEQFNQYKVEELHVNGENTQGENIADLGGVVMGLEAFHKTKQYKDNVKIAGLTPTQRYFLAYAYAWMVNKRVEAQRRQIMTNEHAPEQFRVLGPLSNMVEFYEAFNIKDGQPMWRDEDERVVIW
ncbi:MAG: M13 family metallopeptidase [Bacteroidetes bacterium]|nr:M13 family metallopeptidase [Bacteroidota bacterium]